MKKIKNYVPVLGLILVIIAGVMMFIEPPLISKVTILGTTITEKVKSQGYKIILGLEKDFELNVLGAVSLGLLALGGLIPIFNQKSKQATLFAAVALIAGGILMFVFPSTIDVPLVKFVPAWPVIVAGIAGILAGVLNLLKLAV